MKSYKRYFAEGVVEEISNSENLGVPNVVPENTQDLEPYIRKFGVEDVAKSLIQNDDDFAKSIMQNQGQNWATVKNMPNTVGVIAAELQPVEVEDKDATKSNIQQNQNASVIINKNA